MMKAFIIFIIAFLLLCHTGLLAQSLRYPQSAGYLRMGGYSKNLGDPISFRFNQAALGAINSVGAAVYCEKRFGLKELGLYHASACIPVSFGGIGVSGSYFGFDAYKETQLGIAYGKSLGKVYVGIQINSHSIQIAGYGKDGFLTVEAGMILHLSDQLRAGLHVFNPNGSKFGTNHVETASPVISAGMGFQPSEVLFLGGQIIKESGKPINVNSGIQYIFSKTVFFRVGVLSESPNFYFGVGFKWNSLHLDVTASYHPQLGLTPGMLLVFDSKVVEE